MNGAARPRVVIVGGGPAGAVAATVLAHLGHRATVLEARDGPAAKVGEVLPPSVNPLLARLGLLDRLERDGHLRSYGNRAVWGSPAPVDHDFLRGVDGPGWHIDRRKFEASLAERAQEVGVDWRHGCRLERCTRWGEGWILDVRAPSGPDRVEADLVVDATGRPARLATALGARRTRDDRLVAAAVLMDRAPGGGRCPDSFTLVEAMPSGWWYSAPLPDGQLSVMFLTDADRIGPVGASGTAGWMALLHRTEQTARRVCDGAFHGTSRPRIVPANSATLDPPAGRGWLAVGDAAASFDPLSSFGIGAAMGTSYHAAHAIAEALEGRIDALDNYALLVKRLYRHYLDQLRRHYRDERRWPDAEFWRRRHRAAYTDLSP